MATNSTICRDRPVALASRSSPFLMGAASGALSTVMFQPFDLVKTRMQMHVLLNHANCAVVKLNTVGTFATVIRRETVFGLWKGVRPSLQRCVPGIGMYFGCMEVFRSAVSPVDGRLSPLKALMISASARGITAVTLLPITVVKARYESGVYSYRSVSHALSSIWAADKLKGLYRGLSVTLARDLPFSSVYFVLYSQTTQHLRALTGQTHLNIGSILFCGFGSGLVASVLTQPFDVIKTRVQVSNVPNESVTGAIRKVIGRENGFKNLYTGLTPRLMRRTCMAAFTWLFYEEMKKILGK